ncbi:MAG TPA: hypothetical protein VME19_13805 [Streptosporangiaceae bacterium]|nr:hypothetical protein [Streptosporangiaceae bacterium]
MPVSWSGDRLAGRAGTAVSGRPPGRAGPGLVTEGLPGGRGEPGKV